MFPSYLMKSQLLLGYLGCKCFSSSRYECQFNGIGNIMYWKLFKTDSSRGKRNRKAESGHYVYTQLQYPDEIRLLSLAPRNNTAGLQDAIQHVQLSTSPLYTAMSWRWGKPGDLVVLEVDSNTLMVQRNLRKIVELLRDDQQPRRVWIDAISIDQRTLNERNHQVQVMGKIYRNANYLVACLATDRPKDDKRLKREAEDLHKLLGEGRYYTTTSPFPHFFGNPYFTRRWIIQEIAQAQAVVFCCKGHLLPMSILRDAIKDRVLKISIDAEQGQLSGAGRTSERQAMQLFSTENTQDSSTSLENLLYSHEKAECSDFRDKIYVLISLTPEAQTHFSVHYDIGQSQLMLKVLKFCHTYQNLSAFGTLSFISFLEQHLEVRRDELLNTVLQTPPSDFRICGTIRGKIETLQPGRDIEEAAWRIRHTLPLLFSRHHIQLTWRGPTSLAIDSMRHTQPGTAVGISGIDQCLFSFTGVELPDEARDANNGLGITPR